MQSETTFTQYREIRAVNWSSLKQLRVSPLQYQYRLSHEMTDSAMFRVGRAAHTSVLEPEAFASRHTLFPGASRRGKAWEAYLADYAGDDPRDILIEREADLALGCADAIRNCPEAMRHLHGGVAEHTITWTDADTGLACKARCDSVNGHLVDLKATAYVSPRLFPSEAARLGYHGQIAFYLDGLVASGLLPADSPIPPVIVAVQSEPPHDVVVWTIPGDTIETGRCLYKRLMLRLIDCRDSGLWPGVAPEPVSLALPAWATKELEDDGEMQALTIGGVAVEV